MTAGELRREIDGLIVVLAETGLLVKSNATIIESKPPLTWVTWGGTTARSPLGGETVAEYRSILRNQQYTALLADGGVLQISFALRGTRLEKHRFCWIPSPVIVSEDEAATTDVAELVDEGLLDAGVRLLDDEPGDEDLLLIAPLRFDYDLAAQHEYHAACHLTFNRPSCRVPVFGPLSLGHFVRFVFRNFYPEQWLADARLRGWILRFGPRLVTTAQESEMFIECRQAGGLLARIAKQRWRR
jgi:hypothetical protein